MRVELTAVLRSPGLVVVSDMYYPGLDTDRRRPPRRDPPDQPRDARGGPPRRHPSARLPLRPVVVSPRGHRLARRPRRPCGPHRMVTPGTATVSVGSWFSHSPGHPGSSACCSLSRSRSFATRSGSWAARSVFSSGSAARLNSCVWAVPLRRGSISFQSPSRRPNSLRGFPVEDARRCGGRGAGQEGPDIGPLPAGFGSGRGSGQRGDGGEPVEAARRGLDGSGASVPGQLAKPATRMPPSYTSPFQPRRGRLLPRTGKEG